MSFHALIRDLPLENYKRAPAFWADVRYFQGVIAAQFSLFSSEKLLDLKTFSTFAPMKAERIILAYKNYFRDFIQSLTDAEARKVFYVIDMLKTQERVNAKFVKYLREEIFELRAEQGGNIFRVFFIFDEGNVVMLFNGFQKKTQKTPEKEINKAIQLKKEYYAEKK